jgi:tetratricopeptide (TPR) repeat protein
MKQLSQQELNHLMMLHQQSRYAEGIKEAQRLIKSFPGEMMLFNILGVCFEQEGAFQKAADAYKQALSINPAIPELQFNLGAMLYALNEPKKAIHHYEEAIRLNPNFTEAYFNLGTLHQSQSEYSQAINAYEKALTIQPGFYEALANIGTIKQLQGRLDEAIECFKRTITIQEDAKGHYNLAGAYRNQGNLILAIDHFKKAIDLGSNEPEFYSDLGDALWHDGQIKAAKEFLHMAVKIDPQHPRANYQLAVFLYDNKEFKLAMNYFEQSQFEDWQERVLYCHYKLKQFELFEDKLLALTALKNNSPFLATLSTHFAQNFQKQDPYKFCPSPLDFVCHQKIPELTKNNKALIKSLLSDIDSADIGQRKQSRLTAGIQSSGNLFKRPEQSFQILKDALIKVIAEYYQNIKNRDCEFVRSFPTNIEFSSSWYVKMQNGGHLNSHIHEDGWISGAVYLSIPPQTLPSDDGSIELSTDGDDYPKMHNDFPIKTILPEAGEVIFFPSSVFHRTIPFQSDEERICIAFDVKPEA